MKKTRASAVTALAIIGLVLTGLAGAFALVSWRDLGLDLVFVPIVAGLALVVGLSSRWIAAKIRRLPHPPRVFISYPRDEASTAREISSRLKKAGARVWLDQEQISPGKVWRDAIDNAIADSDSMVTLVSGSTSGWLGEEVNKAKLENVKIIPVLLEHVDLPEYLSGIQFIDLTANKDEGLDDLVESST